VKVSVGTSHLWRVDGGVCGVLFTVRFFGGQIYKFSPSSGGHAPVSCVRRQSLVLQPLSTAVRSLGDRHVAFTRLGDFRFGSCVRAANRVSSPCVVVLVIIGGFWCFRVDGLVLWCRRVPQAVAFPADSSSVEPFLFCYSLCFFGQFALYVH
jgi:hypothetical protein